MRARLWLLGIIAVSLTLGTGRANGQERDVEWFIKFEYYDGVSPSVLYVMRLLSVPEAEEELQLSGQQQAKITDWYPKARRKSLEIHRMIPDRKEISREKYERIVKKYNDARAALQAKYRPLVWKLLNEAQRDRLQQLIWQARMGFVLTHGKTFRKHVPLTDEQERAIEEASRQYVEERSNLQEDEEQFIELWLEAHAKRDQRIFDVLTDEQKAAWAELTGEPFDLRALRLGMRGVGK